MQYAGISILGRTSNRLLQLYVQMGPQNFVQIWTSRQELKKKCSVHEQLHNLIQMLTKAVENSYQLSQVTFKGYYKHIR